MTSLKALERRIESDRAAVGIHYRALRQAVNRQVGSPGGLFSGFAVGFAGGWLTMSRAQRRRERQAQHPEPPSHQRAEPRPKESKLALLRTVMMVSMPLWQKMLMSSAPPPQDGHDDPP